MCKNDIKKSKQADLEENKISLKQLVLMGKNELKKLTHYA